MPCRLTKRSESAVWAWLSRLRKPSSADCAAASELYQQSSFRPGVRRPLALRRDDLAGVIALRNAVGLPIDPCPFDRTEGLRAFPQCHKLLRKLLGGHVQCRQRTQVIVTVGLDARSRVQRRHFAIADIQQAWRIQARAHPCDGGQIQRVIGPFAREHLGGQRQAQRVQRRQHDLELPQVRSMVLAMSQLQQAVLTHGPITAGGCRVQAHAVGVQVIHPHQVPRQFLLECPPVLIVAQVLQDISQSVITQIAHLQRGVATASQRFQATLRPGLHAIHPMVGLREHMGQPDRGHLPQAQPLAVAVRREVGIQQAGYAHALHLGQQQREIVYPLRPNRQWFIHLTSVSESLDCVQIYANRELLMLIISRLWCVSNRDIILKSARVKLPSWGAWDILKATWLKWSRCLKEGTHVSTRGTIHDQRDVSQGCLN